MAPSTAADHTLESLQLENEHLKAVIADLKSRDHSAPDLAFHEPCSIHGWEAGGHCLTQQQVERYSRQLLLPSFGLRGVCAAGLLLCVIRPEYRALPAAQQRLCEGSALVIGAGGLGCPTAIYLAGAGVGRLGIVDRDVVEVSNLHRQVLHTEARAGMHKALSAAAACRVLNPIIEVYLSYAEAAEIIINQDGLQIQLDCRWLRTQRP